LPGNNGNPVLARYFWISCLTSGQVLFSIEYSSRDGRALSHFYYVIIYETKDLGMIGAHSIEMFLPFTQ
jgi:hypothetical protein